MYCTHTEIEHSETGYGVLCEAEERTMSTVYILWDKNGMIKIFSSLEKAKNFFYILNEDRWIEMDAAIEWVYKDMYRITCESVD